MTGSLKEREKKALEEIMRLAEESNAEDDKITAELKRTGKYKYGLDGDNSAYSENLRKFKLDVLAVFDKYDLPNKPNWE